MRACERDQDFPRPRCVRAHAARPAVRAACRQGSPSAQRFATLSLAERVSGVQTPPVACECQHCRAHRPVQRCAAAEAHERPRGPRDEAALGRRPHCAAHGRPPCMRPSCPACGATGGLRVRSVLPAIRRSRRAGRATTARVLPRRRATEAAERCGAPPSAGCAAAGAGAAAQAVLRRMRTRRRLVAPALGHQEHTATSDRVGWRAASGAGRWWWCVAGEILRRARTRLGAV